MKDRTFLDTNILVYADDLDAGAKRTRAREILRDAMSDGTGVLSTQVLQEFFVVATRKLGVEAAVARRKVELLAAMDIIAIDLPRILGAIDLHRLHTLSFWDALVVQCAADAGCSTLLTEDLQDGQVIAGVRVQNPFVGTRRP